MAKQFARSGRLRLLGSQLDPEFRALPDCQLMIMCDLDTLRLRHLQTIYPEVEGATDYSHMLNGINLDAVVIATNRSPTIIHGQSALLAGKTYFHRKTDGQFRGTLRLSCGKIARRNGLVLMTAIRFFIRCRRKIQEIINQG